MTVSYQLHSLNPGTPYPAPPGPYSPLKAKKCSSRRRQPRPPAHAPQPRGSHLLPAYPTATIPKHPHTQL